MLITKWFFSRPAFIDLLAAAASSAGATWLLILSILILCLAPARFLNGEKNPGVGSNKYNKNTL